MFQSREMELRERLSRTEQQLQNERANIIDLNRQLSARDAEYRGLREKLEDQQKSVLQLQEKFAVEFKNLANDIFEEKSKKFTDQNKNNIGDLLRPLGERLKDFEKKIDETNKDSLLQNSALREQLKGLKELNIQMTKEAENLTRALKGDTKTQGNWGELILETVLEKSGLEKGREYLVQGSYTAEDGKRFQPDVIINLPDNKNIIIDSKVTLTAYERYINANDEGDKANFLKAHLQAFRAHIKNLSGKNYQNLYKVRSLDFVLMFVPIEPAFSLGVQHDPSLFTDAYEKNIVLVSPATLLATLRTISNIWKNEYQNQNALEIARQGGDLYDKFVGFTDDLLSIGKNLDSTQKIYLEAMNKLVEGRGNLIGRAERIKKLGAAPSKNIDKRLLDKAEE